MAQPDVKERLAAQGNIAAAGEPEVFRQMLRRTVTQRRDVIGDARLDMK